MVTPQIGWEALSRLPHSSSCSGLFPLANRLAIGVVIDVPACVHVPRCSRLHRVAKIALGRFCFALDLLGSSIDLRACIAGPLADLPLRAACRVIHCSLDFVVIHMSTSVGIAFVVLRPAISQRLRKRRALSYAPLHLKPDFPNSRYSAALRPDISWITRTTSARTSNTWIKPPIV